MNEATLREKVGEAVRKYRKGLGLSQESFADRIGMHRAYYSSIERGERNLTLASLDRVARGLGVQLSTLLQKAGY